MRTGRARTGARSAAALLTAIALMTTVTGPVAAAPTDGNDLDDPDRSSGLVLDRTARVADSNGQAVPAHRAQNALRISDAPPLPPLPVWVMPPHAETGRRVVYSKTNQWVWTVEDDGTISSAQAVSGRRTWNQPLVGTYQVTSRSALTCNITNRHICMRFMVRFTKGPDGDNIGFHEIPVNHLTGQRLQTDAQLGTARSGGCIRMSTSSAEFMWQWAPVGTKVVVLP